MTAARPHIPDRFRHAAPAFAGVALVLLETGAVAGQPADAVSLTSAVQPPTRVMPGDEVEMIVYDPARFPADGRWTIGGRPVEPDGAADAYRLAFTVPVDLPSEWNRLPIVYADRGGRILYDSRLDARDAVALAGISDLGPFIEGAGRVSGVTPRVFPGERFCICGFFPDRRTRQGLRLDGAPLDDPISVSGTQLWFRMPVLEPGRHEITGDPAAGFAPGARAAVEVAESRGDDSGDRCPCASAIEFLADGVATGPPSALEREPAADSPRLPLVWLESLGGSTGEVLSAHIVTAGGQPVEIDGLFAVEPVSLSPEEKERVRTSIRQGAGNHADARANFYCLQFGAAAPPEGVVYRLASPQKQARFQPAARALAAARRLYEGNRLSPDTRPESYFHSIRQWAVWTLEQGFDREGFLSAFVEHAKKNVAEAGEVWSDEFSERVLRSAEGRWEDITKVLGEAGLETGGTSDTQKGGSF